MLKMIFITYERCYLIVALLLFFLIFSVWMLIFGDKSRKLCNAVAYINKFIKSLHFNCIYDALLSYLAVVWPGMSCCMVGLN